MDEFGLSKEDIEKIEQAETDAFELTPDQFEKKYGYRLTEMEEVDSNDPEDFDEDCCHLCAFLAYEARIGRGATPEEMDLIYRNFIKKQK